MWSPRRKMWSPKLENVECKIVFLLLKNQLISALIEVAHFTL